MMYFGIGALILAIIVGALSIFLHFRGSFITTIVAVFFAIVGIGCLIMPSGIGGKYTLKGKLIWNKYLVYATALGVADQVYKAMKLHVYGGLDNPNYTANDLFMFYYLGGYHHIDSSFATASSTISAANNDSIGGIGGGSGGNRRRFRWWRWWCFLESPSFFIFLSIFFYFFYFLSIFIFNL